MSKKIETKAYIKYAFDVISGHIIAGEYIRLSCQRFINDLERTDLYLDMKEVDYCIEFISLLKHYTSKHANKPFILSSWQKFIVANLVGLRRKKDGRRKYTDAFIQVARKQGKSAFLSALCVYFAIADGENNAEVVLSANSKNQAKIDFEMCQTFCRQLDAKGELMQIYRDEIKIEQLNNSRIKCVAADSSKLDGLNCSVCLIDEYEEAKNSKIRDVLKSSQGMRNNPLSVVICTAGFDKQSVCYTLRNQNIDILRGIINDDNSFSAIYEFDEGDDYTDIANAIKANPNLGVTVSKEWLINQINQAQYSTTDAVSIKTKNLNMWVDSATAWLADDDIIKVMSPIDFSIYNQDVNDFGTYIGIDLASTTDLSAVSFMTFYNEKYYYHTRYYLPSDSLNKSPLKNYYSELIKHKQINLTEGNVTDYRVILSDIMSFIADNNAFVHCVAYDPYNATQFITSLTEQGLYCEAYSQTLGNFNAPTKELERQILSRNCIIERSELTRYNFKCVRLKSDWNGNIKVIKDGSNWKTSKVDGVIAMQTALGYYLQSIRY